MPSADPLADAQALVTELLRRLSAPIVIEAGCGARSHLTYSTTARVLGIDLLRTQLQRNVSARHRTQGDVTALPVASAAADLAVCWDVLEHVRAPEHAVRELARVLRPGGLVVLALPNILSMKGVVTRVTPWRVHVWAYRHVLGDRTAGTNASDQFPTAFRFVLRPKALRRLASRHGLLVESLALYEGPVPTYLRRRYRAAHVLLTMAGTVSRVLSLGRYDTTLSDMVVVLRRTGAPAAQ